MNFIISVPGKSHCILEKVTNCPGQSQVTLVLEARVSLRKFMIMGQFAKPFPGFCAYGIIKFLNSLNFSSEDLDFTKFSFDVLEIIQCVFIKRETVIGFTFKSYATYSILFQGDFYTLNTTRRN